MGTRSLQHIRLSVSKRSDNHRGLCSQLIHHRRITGVNTVTESVTALALTGKGDRCSSLGSSTYQIRNRRLRNWPGGGRLNGGVAIAGLEHMASLYRSLILVCRIELSHD
jgi:hypothetical protein